MDFDENRLYYSHQQLQRQPSNEFDEQPNDDVDATVEDDDNVDLDSCRRHFREFLSKQMGGKMQRRLFSYDLSKYSETSHLKWNHFLFLFTFVLLTGNYRLTHRYIYRDKLLRMYRRLSTDAIKNGTRSGNNNNKANSASNNKSMLEVDVAHLGEYDGSLLGHLRQQPAKLLPVMELAASDALDTLLYDQRKDTADEDEDEDDDLMENEAGATENADGKKERRSRLAIQVLLKGNLTMTPLRSIKSEHMHRLIKCPGIVISAAPVKCRAIQLKVRCARCLNTQTVKATDGPFGTIHLPSRCQGADSGECGSNPYSVVPDDSQFCDRQTLKLQEAPEKVPTGEMPRSVLVTVERSLVDKAPPGTRISVFCVPTLFSNAAAAARSTSKNVKSVYLRVVGLSKDYQTRDTAQFTPAEEAAFAQLARRPDVYDILTRSVAPSISGSYTVDIKKALICQLMGGTRKRLPDGMRLRGDINVLLLGDPSTAKSQFLKFVSKTSPVGIYTSGKGSSAAGLTASVVKDSKGEFYLEGGAMVLADGGIVCIDEFDKMRPADRVAIHEAMEQQTISVAKAGITTVLNSRSSVLAAANPVFGRYDELKSASENIDLMTTILSRFDMIFLVRDIREEERDRMICRHVMGVHINNSGSVGISEDNNDGLGFLSAVTTMQGQTGKRYVFRVCTAKCVFVVILFLTYAGG